MLNQPRSMAQGQASDIAIKAKEVALNRRTTCELIASATQKPFNTVMEDCQRVKYFVVLLSSFVVVMIIFFD